MKGRRQNKRSSEHQATRLILEGNDGSEDYNTKILSRPPCGASLAATGRLGSSSSDHSVLKKKKGI